MTFWWLTDAEVTSWETKVIASDYPSSVKDITSTLGDDSAIDAFRHRIEDFVHIQDLDNFTKALKVSCADWEIENIDTVIDFYALYHKKLTRLCVLFSHSTTPLSLYHNIVHSMKNLLSRFIMTLELVQYGVAPDDVFSDMILPCLDQITKLCDFLSSGIQLRPVSLQSLLTQIFSLHDHEWITLLNNVSEDALVDDFLCTNILEELLTNAVKYTPTWWSITVSTGRINTENMHASIEFCVHNTGSHIPPWADIFAKWTSSPGINNQIGTGIWLPWIKDLLSLYKQDIRYESDDQWTTFFFTLPLMEQNN